MSRSAGKSIILGPHLPDDRFRFRVSTQHLTYRGRAIKVTVIISVHYFIMLLLPLLALSNALFSFSPVS